MGTLGQKIDIGGCAGFNVSVLHVERASAAEVHASKALGGWRMEAIDAAGAPDWCDGNTSSGNLVQALNLHHTPEPQLSATA